MPVQIGVDLRLERRGLPKPALRVRDLPIGRNQDRYRDGSAASRIADAVGDGKAILQISRFQYRIGPRVARQEASDLLMRVVDVQPEDRQPPRFVMRETSEDRSFDSTRGAVRTPEVQ